VYLPGAAHLPGRPPAADVPDGGAQVPSRPAAAVMMRMGENQADPGSLPLRGFLE